MPTSSQHGSPRCPSRGYTIIELLVVVAIVAVLAGVAVWSMTPNTSAANIKDFAEEIQTAFKEARTRATSTGIRHAVKVTDLTVQWCHTDCPPNTRPSDAPIGRLARRHGRVKAASYARVADIGITDSLPTRTSLTPAGTIVYFYGDGTMDSDRSTPQQEGFTVYLEHTDRDNLKYRIAVLPLSGDIRVYDEW